MRILLAEDDMALSEAIAFHLRDEGYAVDVFPEGGEALAALVAGTYDAAILDRMLPGLDGLTLLKRARAAGFSAPVLFLTALGMLKDRVEGLDAGADDYITKPFATEELLARLRAIARRDARSAPDIVSAQDISLDAEGLLLHGPESSCKLSRREAQLLDVLLREYGKPLRRETLFARVWGADADVENGNLDTYIHFLRRKIRETGSACHIVTLRGVGFRLEKLCANRISTESSPGN